MSTFYLLPSRPELGEGFAGYLSGVFPGLTWSRTTWAPLAEALVEIAARQPDVFIVYRQELPEGDDTSTALGDGFGATAGDEVVEIQDGSIQRWRIGAPRA